MEPGDTKVNVYYNVQGPTLDIQLTEIVTIY